jgi:hypothetical protein
MGNFDGHGVRQRLLPGCEGHGIDLTVIDSQNGNERFTPTGREQILGRFVVQFGAHEPLRGRRYAPAAEQASDCAVEG